MSGKISIFVRLHNRILTFFRTLPNILDGKSEQERVVYHDKCEKNGFVLLPSMNWPGDVEDLYLITLPNRKDLSSIRDLRQEHVSFLENIIGRRDDSTRTFLCAKIALIVSEMRK